MSEAGRLELRQYRAVVVLVVAAFFLALGLSVAAKMCSVSPMPRQLTDADAQELMQQIRYVYDSDRGVCFAVVSSAAYSSYHIVSISAVPVTACRIQVPVVPAPVPK